MRPRHGDVPAWRCPGVKPTSAGSVDDRVRELVDGFDGGSIPRPLSAISFWSAIALPLLYLPMLAAGIESVQSLSAFLGLFGLHVLALVGGHRHAEGPGR